MSKAAYKHESEQKLSMRYIRIIGEYNDQFIQYPLTYDFDAAIQALIDAKPEHKKIILKMKDKVLRGEKE